MAAFTRSFDCGEGEITMAPVGAAWPLDISTDVVEDMVNHSATPNVVYYCERDMLKFTTRRAIKESIESRLSSGLRGG